MWFRVPEHAKCGPHSILAESTLLHPVQEVTWKAATSWSSTTTSSYAEDAYLRAWNLVRFSNSKRCGGVGGGGDGGGGGAK